MTLRPLILERFLDPKSTQDREKVLSKSSQKSSRFLIRFLIDFGSILDPTGHLKIPDFSSIWAPFGSPRATLKLRIFHQILLLASLLGHLGAKRVPKVLQGSSRGRFSKNLVPFWAQCWKEFLRFSTFSLIEFPISCHIACSQRYFNLQLQFSVLGKAAV